LEYNQELERRARSIGEATERNLRSGGYESERGRKNKNDGSVT
jgi:hypothetical protein